MVGAVGGEKRGKSSHAASNVGTTEGEQQANYSNAASNCGANESIGIENIDDESESEAEEEMIDLVVPMTMVVKRKC